MSKKAPIIIMTLAIIGIILVFWFAMSVIGEMRYD